MIEIIAAVWSALPRREARRGAQPKGHTRRQASRNAIEAIFPAGSGHAAALHQAQSYHTRHQAVYGPCPFSRQTAKAVHELGHADAARLQQEQESLRDHPRNGRSGSCTGIICAAVPIHHCCVVPEKDPDATAVCAVRLCVAPVDWASISQEQDLYEIIHNDPGQRTTPLHGQGVVVQHGIDLILETPSTKGEQWNLVRDGSD